MRRTAERALRQRAQLFQVFEQNEHHTLKIIGRFARRIRVPAHNAAHHLEVRGEVLIIVGCHGWYLFCRRRKRDFVDSVNA